jgi:hypothetical protein
VSRLSSWARHSGADVDSMIAYVSFPTYPMLTYIMLNASISMPDRLLALFSFVKVRLYTMKSSWRHHTHTLCLPSIPPSPSSALRCAAINIVAVPERVLHFMPARGSHCVHGAAASVARAFEKHAVACALACPRTDTVFHRLRRHARDVPALHYDTVWVILWVPVNPRGPTTRWSQAFCPDSSKKMYIQVQ